MSMQRFRNILGDMGIDHEVIIDGEVKKIPIEAENGIVTFIFGLDDKFIKIHEEVSSGYSNNKTKRRLVDKTGG